MRSVFLSALLLLSITSPVTGEPTIIEFPGLRPRAEALRGGVQYQANEDFAPALHRAPVACSGLVATAESGAVIVDYEGGIPDAIEDLRPFDVQEPDVLTIELDYADASADLDLVLIRDDRIVAISNVDAEGRSEKIVTLVTAGRYSIGVSAVRGASVYTLRSSIADSASLLCEPATETEPERPDRPFGGAESNHRRPVGRPARPPNCTFNVSPMTPTVPQAGGMLTINVTAEPGCDWKASSGSSFMKLVWGSAAYGNGTAGFSVTPHTGTSNRTGNLTVAGRSVSVTQLGPCTYTVAPTNPSIPASGGTYTVAVTTRDDCDWTSSVATTATWLNITGGQSGKGNGTVTYTVAPNPSTSSRTGTMSIAGKTVSVKQALDISSCTYSLDYTSRTLTWCGGERSVRVTTQGECPWTSSVNAPWLALGGTADRSGTGSLFYFLDRNTGPARNGTVTVAGIPVAISQKAQANAGAHDGVWKGMTAQSREVELCVADEAVQDGVVRVRLSFPSFSCTGPLTIFDHVPISSNAFSGTFTFLGSTITTNVSGTFTSPTAMNGTHGGFTGTYVIICGSSLAIGSGTVLSPGTYTATKQP